ncbi:MAG: preprotein translocase subunit SecG, partial [Clostridia bacterium]|nr:preprotein translocase subunit SecG [Clostridia bacterium]
MEIAIGILLILAAIFLVVAVLMQSGKSHNLSGTIAGGAETFFGKSKATTLDKKLSKLTTIVAIVFVVLVLVSYLTQNNDGGAAVSSSSSVATVDSTSAVAEEAAEVTEEAA